MTKILQLQYRRLIKKYSGGKWKYIAIDEDGRVYLYYERPIDKYYGFVGAGPCHGPICVFDKNQILSWRDTLTELK